jgi:N-acetylglucosaminyl-diphospho-decaprenol L-rhamnosyltransferase
VNEIESTVISIVSHQQAALVSGLLADIAQYCAGEPASVVLTINTEEPMSFSERDFTFPLKIIRNKRPKGFGANHNAAFRIAQRKYFCIANPDIRLLGNPLPSLLANFENNHVGLAAPIVVNSAGEIEITARRFPTPFRILRKCWEKEVSEYSTDAGPAYPDWVAGMFMLLPARVYADVGGFDERYHLYYEDVDLCARLTLAGHKIVLDNSVRVVHDARRQSHRDPAYFKWHLASMTRFFLSPVFFRALSRTALSNRRSQ